MDADAKTALRDEARRRRAALDGPTRSEAASDAAAHLLGLPEIEAAGTIALYSAHGDELDPAPAVEALRARGVTTVLPRVDGASLVFVAVGAGDALEPGYRGVQEPAGAPAAPEEIDVIIVPGVAFDRAGGRLGQGGGHYDRLLATLPARVLRVGYAFACQVVDAVPRSPHDQPVDVVVTEDGAIRTSGRS